jgi:hypothetical protein
MTRTEGKYWGMWREICALKNCKSGDSRFRHAMHVIALGAPKSHTLFTHSDWDRVFATMKTLLDGDDLDARLEQLAYEQHDDAARHHSPDVRPGKGTTRVVPSKYERMPGADDPGERRRLNFALRIFEPPLIAAICRDRFDVADWNALSVRDLTDLRDLLNNRLYAWLKEVKAGRVEYHFPFPLYDEHTGRILSNKAIRAEFMRLGIVVRMQIEAATILADQEEPF